MKFELKNLRFDILVVFAIMILYYILLTFFDNINEVVYLVQTYFLGIVLVCLFGFILVLFFKNIKQIVKRFNALPRFIKIYTVGFAIGILILQLFFLKNNLQ